VIAHPADDRWERTTKLGSPVFEAAELDAIEDVRPAGGGLIVMAECEQDKYGTNVTELLSRFGVGVENVTIQDASHCFKGVAHWVLAEPQTPTGGDDLLAGVESACFYRSGARPPRSAARFCCAARRRPTRPELRWPWPSRRARAGSRCSPTPTCSVTTPSTTMIRRSSGPTS
jgi:hypothetical protein